MIYDNHIEEILDKNTNYIYVDVGGGSTEISLISEGKLKNSRSYNIGTVRLLEGTVKKIQLPGFGGIWQSLPHFIPNSALSAPEETLINYSAWPIFPLQTTLNYL